MTTLGQKSPNPITLKVLFAARNQTMTALAIPITCPTAAMLMQLHEEILAGLCGTCSLGSSSWCLQLVNSLA